MKALDDEIGHSLSYEINILIGLGFLILILGCIVVFLKR
jgi:hypothetical protein